VDGIVLDATPTATEAPVTRSRRVLSAWMVLAVALLLAAGAALAIGALHDRANAARQAEIFLLETGGLVAGHDALAHQALAGLVPVADLQPRIDDTTRRLDAAMGELDRFDAGVARAVAATAERYRTAAEDVADLLRQDRRDEAAALQTREVGPRLGALEQTITEAVASERAEATAAHRTAAIGSLAVVVVAVLLITALSWRLGRARRRVSSPAEGAAGTSDARFRALVQHSTDLYMILDADGALRDANPSVGTVLGQSPEALDGRPLTSFLHPDDLVAARQTLDEVAIAPGRGATIEVRLGHLDGTYRRVEANLTNLLAEPSVGGIVVSARDVSERAKREDELVHQAFHDPLTNLPNRALFRDRLEHALARSVRRAGAIGVLFVDLDDFKGVNDRHGHKAGDQLLSAVGTRLRGSVREGDTVARLGGDEFAVLLEDIDDPRGAMVVADRILHDLAAPVALDGPGAGREVHVTASLGVALSGSAYDRPEDLLRDADLAMEEAKTRGKGRARVFDAGMNARAWARLELETDLRRAVKQGELRVLYQPVVSLETGRIVEVEALVRWQHPERGLLTPADFVPLAEETGLIVPIGQWVLETGCAQVRAWQERHPEAAGLVLNVNVAGRQFADATLVADVARAVLASGLDPACLKLEITEGVAMENADATIATLQELETLGIRLAIDDFGTGYAALTYLERFPIDTLKIDRAFVSRLGTDADERALVRAVIAFAKMLNLTVTAEGVETEDQVTRLRALGCDRAQGYHFARPLTGEALAALLGASSAQVAGPTAPLASATGVAAR